MVLKTRNLFVLIPFALESTRMECKVAEIDKAIGGKEDSESKIGRASCRERV